MDYSIFFGDSRNIVDDKTMSWAHGDVSFASVQTHLDRTAADHTYYQPFGIIGSVILRCKFILGTGTTKPTVLLARVRVDCEDLMSCLSSIRGRTSCLGAMSCPSDL